jgi:hypothetical protein
MIDKCPIDKKKTRIKFRSYSNVFHHVQVFHDAFDYRLIETLDTIDQSNGEILFSIALNRTMNLIRFHSTIRNRLRF